MAAQSYVDKPDAKSGISLMCQLLFPDTMGSSIDKVEPPKDLAGKELGTMNTRLAEFWMEETCRKPMTPAQMVHFYGRTVDHRSSRVDRFMSALGRALVALGQRVKPENIAQTAKPAYQGKK